MRHVIVYTQPGCSACHAQKEWMRSQGLAYEDRNIAEHQGRAGDLQHLGSHATPTTVVETDAEREVVIGFDRGRLQHLLG